MPAVVPVLRRRLMTGAPWLRAVRWATPFALALLVYVVAMTVAPTPFSGDQPHYALEAYSLALDGDRDLSNDYASAQRVERVFGAPSLLPHAYRYRPGGELVSFHAAGLPLLLAPAARISGSIRVLKLEMAVLAALAALLLFRILVRVLPDRVALRWGVWAAVVFSLPMVGYSDQLYPEIPGALCLLLALRVLLEPRVRGWQLAAAGVAAGALPWLHLRFYLLALGIGLAIVLRVIEQRRSEGSRSVAVGLAAGIAPLVVSVVVMAVAYHAWYGSISPLAPLYPPVAQTARSAANPAVTVDASSSTVSIGHLYIGMARSLFSAKTGWLPFMPVALLGVGFLIALAARRSWWAVLGLAVATAYLAQVATAGTLPGFALPTRFELVLVPAVAVPLALAAARLRWVRAAFVPLAALTLLITVLALARVPGLYGDGDPGRGLNFPAASVLLAPWPNVQRQPLPEPRPRYLGPTSFQHTVGDVSADGTAIESPTRSGPGALVTGPALSLPAGRYVVGAALTRTSRAAGADPLLARVAISIDGQVVARDALRRDALAQGVARVFWYELRVTRGQRVAVRITTTAAAGLRVGALTFASSIVPTSGLGLTGTLYPDVPRVAIWVAVVLALAAAMAITLGRRGPRRSAGSTADGPARPSAGAGAARG